MSADLQERRTRAEGKIKELLSSMDSNVQELYLSLLHDGVEKDHLDDDQEVQRLEGFHDYIIVREETGVAHPSFDDFLKVREENPLKLISFGTGQRRSVEYNEDDLETIPDDKMSSLAESGEIEIIGNEEDEVEGFEPDDESEENPVEEYTDIVQESIAKEHEKDLSSTKQPEESESDKEKEGISTKAESFFGENSKNDEEDKEKAANRNAGRLTQGAVLEKEFANKTGGYNKDAVDDFFDNVASFMDARHTVEEYSAKIEEMRNTTFKKERFRSGFLPAEVDGFKEAVIGELEVLKIEVASG